MLPKPSDLLSVEQDSSSHFPNRVLVGFTSMVRKGTLMFWMKHTVLMAEAMEYDKILQRQLIGKWMNVFSTYFNRWLGRVRWTFLPLLPLSLK